MKAKKYAASLFCYSALALYAPNLFADYFHSHSYYSGAGMGLEQINFKDNYGKNFFPKQAYGFDIFLNSQHPRRFGFEIGAGFTPKKQRKITLNAGDKYPGTQPLPAGVSETWRPQYESQYFYVGINRYLPYTVNQSRLKLFGFAGIALTHVKAVINFVGNEITQNPSPALIESSRRTFDETLLIPLVKVGVEYDLHKHVGCRLVYSWKYYALFNSMKPKENPSSSAELRLDNVNTIYLGVYWRF